MGLAIQATVGSVEVVEVFPFLELVVEQLCVVDDYPVEHPIELLCVDSVGSFHLPVESYSRPPNQQTDPPDPTPKDRRTKQAASGGTRQPTTNRNGSTDS
jgi:hypothetical protein